MRIFCNFFKRLLLFQTKNDFYWQPILKKLILLRFWSDGAGFKTEAQKFFMLEQCIPLEGIRKMILEMHFNHTIFRYKRYIKIPY